MLTKFILAGVQRTGTTLIQKTLNSHSNINCMSEVFKIKRWRRSSLPFLGEEGYTYYIGKSLSLKIGHIICRRKIMKSYLDNLYSINSNEAVGFKIMQRQVKRFPSFISYIIDHEIKVLHVLRENVLKILVSRVAAQIRGYSSEKPVGKSKVSIPTSNLIKRLNRIHASNQYWKDVFSGYPNYMCVTYESFVHDSDAECRRMCEFLDQDYEVLKSSLVKLTSDNLSEVIENFEEVKEFLAGTAYEWCTR